MKWSPQQDAALIAFRDWFAAGEEQVFCLFGYAGTGKTTLAIELTQSVEGRVIFGAFTGKAASVMRKKGCSGAQTLHSLLYNAKAASKKRILELEEERANLLAAEEIDTKALQTCEKALLQAKRNANKPDWELNPYSDARDAKLIVVDEVSMVDARLGEDLKSFGKPILVLGDPAQLPPVNGLGYFNTPSPHVMLTEVHRHALDNPVLAMATLVREGKKLAQGTYGESAVIKKAALQGGETLDYDQVLVGRNKTRQAANQAMRRRMGYEGTYPLAGERVVCLRNNKEKGLLNGTLWTVEECSGDINSLELKVRPEEGGEAVETLAYSEPFRYEDAPRWGSGGLDEFTYGYALTAHKAQGSEWPRVYIVDESEIARGDAARWLYTAITRASEKLLLVQ